MQEERYCEVEVGGFLSVWGREYMVRLTLDELGKRIREAPFGAYRIVRHLTEFLLLTPVLRFELVVELRLAAGLMVVRYLSPSFLALVTSGRQGVFRVIQLADVFLRTPGPFEIVTVESAAKKGRKQPPHSA